jgi:hypothetical protein
VEVIGEEQAEEGQGLLDDVDLPNVVEGFSTR